MTKHELKEELIKFEVIKTTGRNNRRVRKAISDLSKEGIIFVPTSSHTYKRIEVCTQEEIMAYYLTQIKSASTHYFNKIKPIKNFIKKENIDELHKGTIFEKGDYYG